MRTRGVLAILLLSLASVAVWTLWARSEKPAATVSAPAPGPAPLDGLHRDTRVVSDAERRDAIARAHVWRAPKVPVARAPLGRDETTPPRVDCRFKIADVDGTTPKFRCVLESGTEIRTKYSRVPEIPAEAAATRLLAALGFGADHVTLVERLRCYGCPLEPFLTMKVVDATRTTPVYERVLDPDKYAEFEWVAIERKFDARPIESDGQKGWGFFELDGVDAAKGGAPRAHVDALRLMAVFLAHWDNKAENQRLVCLSRAWPEGTPCPEPFLLMQDVGATFGPRKRDLEAWERAAVWAHRPTCTISMDKLPYGGGTFGTARVSEQGRRFLVGLLEQLTDAQLAALFASARFDQPYARFVSRTHPISEWVRVFQKRLKAISDGPACPAA
jgi:hypothetical protein